MKHKDKQNAKAATIIMALAFLFFGGPAWIWGPAGGWWAFMTFVSLVGLVGIWGCIFMALNDTPGMGKAGPTPPSHDLHHRRNKKDD